MGFNEKTFDQERLYELQKDPKYKKYVKNHQRKLRRLKREVSEEFLSGPPSSTGFGEED